jgi:predicted Zn-dependent protease
MLSASHAQDVPMPAAAAPAAAPELLPTRFTRPGLDSDEGGLWAMMDREESRLRRSPFALRDKALTGYLQDVACRLGGEHCPDVRVHVVRTPLFNANMAPNGMMQVWTGLLLRLENESQLAAVLGHEMGHYFERHSLERLRDVKSRMAFAQFIGLFGLVGAIGQLGILASAFAYSREHETRADRLGMHLLQQAGYDGRQAARVWDNLVGEIEVTGGKDAGKRSPMLASHPPVETRRDDLLALAGERGGKVGEDEFQRTIAPFRLDWLHDEVKRGQYEESLVLFDRMLKRQPADAEVLFARGEVRRLRATPEDLVQSLADLTEAARLDKAPALTHRSLGLAYRQRQDFPAAVQAFERYLAVAPEAADASLIKTQILELTP